MEGNPVITIMGAAVAGFLFVPTYPLLGGALLMACATWGIKYYREHSKLACVFRNCGLTNKDGQVPQLREKRTSEETTTYRYSLPPGLALPDFEKHYDAIKDFLGKTISIKGHAKNIIIEVYDKDIEQYEYEPNDWAEIGKTRGGKVLKLELEKNPHVLIASETGGGKSTLLRALVVALKRLGYGLYIVDLKGGVEFSFLRKSARAFSKTPDEALEIIASFSDEIQRRYDLLYDADVQEISEYNKVREPLPRLVLVVDEFAELTDKSAMQALKSIAARGRAAGCYLIISTQRPDAEILKGNIKANITNIIGLKTANRINSEIIGIPGLERLRGEGHGILKRGSEFIEFQAPLLTVQEAKKLI